MGSFYGYGVDLTNAELKNLPDFMAEHTPDLYQDCMDDCVYNYDEEILHDRERLNEAVKEWLSEYEYDGYTGISAYLASVINEKENVEVMSHDVDCDILYLLPQLPWLYNEKTKNISEEDFNALLRKYLSEICDDELTIEGMVLYED